MFDKEFYPTPRHVLDLMNLDCNNKTILEPSAGKGDIIDYVKSQRASEVYAYEKNDDLRKIISDKCTVLGSDFFNSSAEDVSHIDLIVMNPPFSNADKHILHAFKIAPEGCEVVALCNYETISKEYYYRELRMVIKDYGDYENLGDCFKKAERKTGVEIGLIKLFKPVVSDTNKFEGFFMDQDEEEETGEGIMQYNEIRSIVNRYVGAVKVFDKLDILKDEIALLTRDFGFSDFALKVGYRDEVATKEQFARSLQRKCWGHVFNKMNLNKFVTKGVMRDINAFIEKQKKYPFTMRNVYRMIEIIIGTRQQTYNRALEEVVDNFTKYTHENRYGIEGWKTNSGHMLNKKFIVNRMVGEYQYLHGNTSDIDDLTKVLCFITGKNYDDIGSIHTIFRKYQFFYERIWNFKIENQIKIINLFQNEDATQESLKELLEKTDISTYYHSDFISCFKEFKKHGFVYSETFKTNTWYKWGFFEFKFFLKGTMHLKFRKEKDWYQLNKAYGELKGFTLADKYSPKTKNPKPRKKSGSSTKITKAKSELSNQLFELFTSSN
ncbi:Predicted RNA methylase [Tenacibaculum sp. MAR_2009_124]|uniref:class I SAM-dependent methyltransferase n=1 Tax=Tenacibaculum sp. MAR_2009_124 TaxID=1250059 RepID=UPI0008965E14|nr:DUF4942 domain-containing protein [Tenacibaculum sp. MAR_2009_124]SEC46175.1 Predicted RNA methylase [Tenacibaculum sp. MAR_2009_124]